jgi:hypothetical protein
MNFTPAFLNKKTILPRCWNCPDLDLEETNSVYFVCGKKPNVTTEYDGIYKLQDVIPDSSCPRMNKEDYNTYLELLKKKKAAEAELKEIDLLLESY